MDGLSLERAALYGMPHVGAGYVGGRARLDDGALCAACGRPATNAHHAVPKGLGGGNLVRAMRTKWGVFVLKSPLFALCGMGNASGCHGRAHSGLLRIRWEWDDEEGRAAWESGELLAHGWMPHDVRLFSLGRYVIEDADMGRLEVRQ